MAEFKVLNNTECKKNICGVWLAMKNGLNKIILTVIILLCIVYCIMLHDTNSVKRDFINCIKSNLTSNETADSELYKYYNRSNDYDDKVYDANVHIKRQFVIHNFRKGVMFVKYNCEAFNKAGEHIYGSSNVHAKWYIEKKDGPWEVVKIIEQP